MPGGGGGGMPGGFNFAFSGGPGGASGFRPGNPRDIFSQLFGGLGGGFGGFSMGYDDDEEGHGGMGGMMGGMGRGAAGGPRGHPRAPPAPAKAPPVQFDLMLTLDELYTGTRKKMRVTRKRRGVNESKVLEIDVAPGWKEGTKVTFANEGDEAANGEAGDVVFVIKEKPHATLTREKNDLRMKLRLSLTEALCGFTKTVEGLGGKTFTVESKEVVAPGKSKYFWGDGMPHKAGRGNFIVDYEIIFPTSLTDSQRTLIQNANI